MSDKDRCRHFNIHNEESICPYCHIEELEHDLLMQKDMNKQKSRLLEQAEAENIKLQTKSLDAIAIMQTKLDAERDENKRLKELMQWFVDRCERGEVRSRKTYAAFKEALQREDNWYCPNHKSFTPNCFECAGRQIKETLQGGKDESR